MPGQRHQIYFQQNHRKKKIFHNLRKQRPIESNGHIEHKIDRARKEPPTSYYSQNIKCKKKPGKH